MPARSIDSATLAFGLVSIPVKIYSTSEPSHELHFHLVHEGCGERLHQQYVCPAHGVVDRDHMVKGYELTKGNFIELTKAELKALDAVASDDIAINEFVPAEAIEPLWIERSYYLGPDKSGERAYQLFRDALADAELVAIASYSARGKQYIVELVPHEDGLVMHQLHYPDEVKPWSEVPLGKHVKASPAELGLARQVIDSLRHQAFDPSRYKDEVKARVRALIAKKAKGGEITAPENVAVAPVTDLMAALKASLGAGGEPPKRSAAKHARHAPATRKAKPRPHTTRASRAAAPRASASSTANGPARRARARR
jgi:DNA end-binding protein Ku